MSDNTETTSTTNPTPTPNDIMALPQCKEVRAQHVNGGHTFLVTTVVTETITKTDISATQQLTPVPINPRLPEYTTIAQQASALPETELPETNPINAIVPLSSSLPSKLLRFHAKRSAQALLHQIEQSQSQSLDSQFCGSEEGATISSLEGNEQLDERITPSPTLSMSPTAPAMSPPPPNSSPVEFIDVGMGSSIEGSEESEEDDELKPLAVDNHMLYDVDLSSPPREVRTSPTHELAPAVLSEANLEKFHKHQHQQHPSNYFQMDNIYLHPNFKHELENNNKDNTNPLNDETTITTTSVGTNTTPTIEPKRVHRSFLTMKKPTALQIDVEKANSIVSQSTASSNTEPTGEHTPVNEIDTLDPTLIPSDELAAEITDAVEFYFSNDSILKDAFLLKHVRRNKEGFVSLKLVSSFKRVRQLTKEWKVVGNAVRRKSNKIELNDLGTKVRRLEPLPNFDETMPSRTIVACDLPLDKLTIEKVSDIFSKCGEIALIRILKPGMAIPVDVRQFMNKYPEMQQKECALVEYLESSSARDAKHLEGPFQVYEMVAPKKKTGKKAVIQIAAPVARMVENYRYYNDMNYERTRGGSFSGILAHDGADMRFKLKRNNSDFNPKTASDAYHNHNQHYYKNPQQRQQSPTHRGSFSNDHAHHYQHYQPRGSIHHESAHQQTHHAASSPSGNMNFFSYAPRRYSNTSTISANTAALGENNASTAPTNSNHNNNNNIINANNGSTIARRLSNGSEHFQHTSDSSRRPSNCSENQPQRRDSDCSESCPCGRRVSDFAPSELQRKTSQSSIGSLERRFSNSSIQFERSYSNASEHANNGNNNMYPRRMSNDYNYERKQSLETHTGLPYENDGNVGGGGGGYMIFPRRYSNNFNINNKLAAYDNAQYINGRRISTDSGYDRRYSFGSEYEGSPRSRTGSFLNNYKHSNDFDGQPRSRTGSFLDGSPRSRSGSFAQRNAENLVRTPIGPDGSKGFGSRTRKFGQTVSPVN
ncbi:uncharacterized protein LOC119681522 [Teleopsis dalmanni]|uniref:uncharacterized protein LOC119681522 n=1 Tax=Teleopsis dalmanni TaxID=139649 RepID=UPI0018CD0884|nr:uncharacterized protein LOC119681522 [Teleopsis dalmanni]